MTTTPGSSRAHARFDVQLTPQEPLVAGTARFDLRKAWSGDMTGESVGVMLSAGDPATGQAGYVAIETFEGELDGRHGGFALQQYGVMDGEASMHYGIVPGSGTDGLAGIVGMLELSSTESGHEVVLCYDLP